MEQRTSMLKAENSELVSQLQQKESLLQEVRKQACVCEMAFWGNIQMFWVT